MELLGPSYYTTIVGIVIGAASIVLLFAASLWALRWRKKREANPFNGADDNRGFEKPQLHSECIPRQPAVELEGSYPKEVPEIGANEIAAHEMLDPDRITPIKMPGKSKG